MSAPPFKYWRQCPDFSSGEIIHYITDPDRARQVSYRTFVRNVDLTALREVDHPALYRISAPDNWAIAFYKSKLPTGQSIYYFDWSRIEHIFVDPEQGWPDPEEMVRLAQDLELDERQPSTRDRSPNPTMKRLRWVAERYPFPVVDQVMWILAEAVGVHDLPVPPGEEEDVAGLLWVAERKLPAHTRYDRYLPWVARQVDELYRLEVPVGRDEEWDALWVGSSGESDAIELRRRFRSVVDWAESERVDLGRYGATQAIAEARRWAQERGLVVPQGTVVYSWDDGWTVQSLTTEEQLKAEGDVMQHCVSEYEVDLGEHPIVLEPGGGAVAIYSLRDPRGQPHATMEYTLAVSLEDRYVAQLRGKQNAVPKPEYLERMVEFRLDHLPGVKLVPVEAPPHADGLRERFAGAYGTPEQERILVYEDGTVLMWDDVGEVRDDLREEALQKFPGDRPAQRQHVVVAFDQLEPSELATEDWARLYGRWLAWAVMVATKGRARIRDTEDEMVNWLAGTRVDPSVCRPFAARAANVAELYGRLTR